MFCCNIDLEIFVGFDTFAEEIGVPQDSMKRNMSLDVQFDEKDIQKVTIIFIF
jgi:hypothetical protein